MDLYKILSLFSIPSALIAYCVLTFKKIKAIRLGTQALLRANLVRDWNEYSTLGYAPLYARENFENEDQQYHNLGANGVMDDIRAKFLALPDKPPKSE